MIAGVSELEFTGRERERVNELMGWVGAFGVYNVWNFWMYAFLNASLYFFYLLIHR